jgi:hypothetical protein
MRCPFHIQRKTFIFLAIFFVSLCACSREGEPVPSDPGKITVLMYHRIVKDKPSNLYERSITAFEADLKYLVENKINVITFNDLEKISSTGILPAGNSVVITFDDGDNSWFTLARPMLLKYKMKATFFLWVNMIGHDSFLSWNEVELMSNYMYPGGERPFTFGSHTYSHQYLLQRKSGFITENEYSAFLDYELGESKKLIESHSPEEVSALSLPFGDGFGDTEIISAAKRNGYKFIRTSKWASIEYRDVNLFMLPGVPMLDTTESNFIGTILK